MGAAPELRLSGGPLAGRTPAPPPGFICEPARVPIAHSGQEHAPWVVSPHKVAVWATWHYWPDLPAHTQVCQEAPEHPRPKGN